MDNSFERSRAALMSLLHGDTGAAGLSLQSTDELSPDERATALLGQEQGPWAFVKGILTNPAFLIGAGLAMRYPIPTVERLGLFAKNAEKLSTDFPGARHLWDLYQNYEGTRVPGILSRIFRTTHQFQERFNRNVARAMEEYHEAAGVAPTKQTLTRVSAALDGLGDHNGQFWSWLRENIPEDAAKIKKGLNLSLTGPEQQLATSLRTNLKLALEDTLEHAKGEEPRNIRRLLKTLGIETPSDIQEIQDYFPHVLKWSAAKDSRKAMIDFSSGTGFFGRKQARVNQATGRAQGFPSSNLYTRKGWSLPNPDELLEAGVISPELAGSVKKAASLAGRPFYLMDPLKVFEKYHFGLAKTKAFLVPPNAGEAPYGDLLAQEYHALRKKDPYRAQMLQDTYIPLASGQLTATQTRHRERFQQLKSASADILEKLPGLPADLKTRWGKWLKEDSPSYSGIGHSVAKYFYGSTLAGNLPSAGTNLLQTILTTVPMIGPKYTMMGLQRTLKAIPEFAKDVSGLMQRKQLNQDSYLQVLRTHFPLFRETGLDVAAPIMEHLDQLVKTQTTGGTFGGGLVAKISRGLMLPFTGAETLNRLVVFEGTRMKAMKDLAGKIVHDELHGQAIQLPKAGVLLEEYAERAAEYVTRQTQFTSGPLGQPYGLVNLPKWASQFATFPVKALGFGLSHGIRYGAEPGGFNLGTLGRSLAGSALAYEVGSKVFDRDLSHGLFFGAMPDIRASGPFAPFPFVPPALQVAGAVGLDLARGSTEESRKALPLLVPGGITMARASTGAAPSIAEFLGKPHADYNKALPDGRIPVYAANGGLVGYYTKTQLFAKSIGLGDIEGSKEAALTRYLLTQRDRMRAYRADYLKAMSENDARQAGVIQAEFEKAYPGLGGIRVKPSDIKAYQLRQDMPRVETILRTMPANVREAFAGVVATQYGLSAEQFLGSTPTGASMGGQPMGDLRGLANGSQPPAAQHRQAGQPGQPRQEPLPTDGSLSASRQDIQSSLGFSPYGRF